MRTLKNFSRISPYPQGFSNTMVSVPRSTGPFCLSNPSYDGTYGFTNGNVIITMNGEDGAYRPYGGCVFEYDSNYTLQNRWCVNIPQIQPYGAMETGLNSYRVVFGDGDMTDFPRLGFNSVDSFVDMLYAQTENTWMLNFNNSANTYKFLDYNTGNQLNRLTVPKGTTCYDREDQQPYYIVTLSDGSKFIIQMIGGAGLSEVYYGNSHFYNRYDERNLANGQTFNCVTK